MINARQATGGSPQRAWDTLLECTAYPSYIPEVLSAEILGQDGNQRISRWVAELGGPRLEWEEVATIDHDQKRIDFRQTRGDLAAFNGRWRIGTEDSRTTVELHLDFNLGIPLMDAMLRPLAEKALQGFADAMLRRIGERATPAPDGPTMTVALPTTLSPTVSQSSAPVSDPASGASMKILLTGSAGVVGSEVAHQLAAAGGDAEVVLATRRPQGDGEVRWVMGSEPAPAELQRHWDVVIHSAASTRWTMTKDEAAAANVDSTEALLSLADAGTHVVHISTAYIEGQDADSPVTTDEFGGYRNGYEWSKAESEELVRAKHDGPLTIVRPPLVFGRRNDGAIARLSGPYAMVQSLVSGLAPALVGDPYGYLELAPVDQVAEVIVNAALGDAPGDPVVETIAAGDGCLTVAQMVDVIIKAVNAWRAERDVPPVPLAPVIPSRSWHNFFLPLVKPHLSAVQKHAIDLLSMFESYTTMATPFRPTRTVENPAQVLERSITWWADAKPRHAKRIPEPWSIVPN